MRFAIARWTWDAGPGTPACSNFNFALPPAEQFMALHRHAWLGRLSNRTMRPGSATLSEAGDRFRLRLYGSSILRHRRERVPRIFVLLGLDRTGSRHHRHRRARRVEDNLFREVLRRADPDDASVHVDRRRAFGWCRQISIGCQEQAEEQAADENEISDDRHEPPLIGPCGEPASQREFSAIVPFRWRVWRRYPFE
ncbi:hypothetical protein ABIF20_005404 [Bradyrhizobium japonicum]